MSAREITQEQFDAASAIFDKIALLQDKQKNAHTLQAKIDIDREIKQLREDRYKILGM